MVKGRDTMLEIFLVLGVYSDPDGSLEAAAMGGGGGMYQLLYVSQSVS